MSRVGPDADVSSPGAVAERPSFDEFAPPAHGRIADLLVAATTLGAQNLSTLVGDEGLADQFGGDYPYHERAAVLADWGADVVKIEPPGGDPARIDGDGHTRWRLVARGRFLGLRVRVRFTDRETLLLPPGTPTASSPQLDVFVDTTSGEFDLQD